MMPPTYGCCMSPSLLCKQGPDPQNFPTKGDGICFYNSTRRCINVTVFFLDSIINYKLIYSPCKFTRLIFVGVQILQQSII